MPANQKPVLVTGASGFVGSHITRLLASQGRDVRAMIRTTSNREALRGLPIELVYGDALDIKSLVRAMKGCTTVFHCVVDPRFYLTDGTPLHRNNVEGLCNAMDAALQCGVERFVFISTIGTLGFMQSGPVTEEATFNWPTRASPYVLSRVEAESKFFSYCREKGLPGVALNVAMTYGPQDYQPTPQNKLLRDMGTGKLRFTWNAGSPPVDIRDVALAAIAAETRGRVGQRYIIANDRMTFRELFEIATNYRGLSPPIVVPYWVVYLAAWIGQTALTLAGKKDFMARTDAVFLSDAFQQMDTSKARNELGWRPRAIAETVRDALDWFASRERGGT